MKINKKLILKVLILIILVFLLIDFLLKFDQETVKESPLKIGLANDEEAAREALRNMIHLRPEADYGEAKRDLSDMAYSLENAS
jgi:hypothetical protein